MTTANAPSSPPAAWQPPPAVLSLSPGEVHVWCADWTARAGQQSSLEVLLSSDENRTAYRFYFESDQQRYITCRGLLRKLLGGYLHRDPAELGFCYGPQGKPALAGRDAQALRFNISHSGELVLLAFARDREVGVDVERMRQVDIAGLAARVFSEREGKALRSLPAEEQEAAFFRCWTRKEAFIKATGRGLAQGLDRFDVSLLPHEGAALLTTADDPAEAPRWSLADLDPGAGYAGALAMAGRARKVRRFAI